MISKETFTFVFGACPNTDTILSGLTLLAPNFELDSKLRLAMFLAQCGHESGHFKITRENLNYSREGLLKVFPKYFNSSNVDQYARNPKKIASKVYGARMGNGSEESEDGWKYRGRGFIQITGYNNYADLDNDGVFDKSVMDFPEQLETPEGALLSAMWFWKKNNLNPLADKGDLIGCTKRINGGTIGLEDRQALYSLLIKRI